MKCFGLKDSAYWISHFISYLVQHTIISLIILAIGYTIPGLLIFEYCNFFVLFATFMSYGVASAGFLCLTSIFFSGTVGANTLAATIFMCGLGASITTAIIGQFMYYWWQSHNFFIQGLLYLSYLMPIFHFLLVLVAIASKTIGLVANNYINVIPPARFTIGDLNVHPSSTIKDVPTPLFSILVMLLMGVIYFGLAIILDHFIFGMQKKGEQERKKEKKRKEKKVES
eukprot:Phypoly_transcript_19224.p1 GENE.Phypoly_transcript_19224~~Phypoly_transcript_19224.p1  ORF type:complete len:240 (+),score=26.51 Phypoly_transcript_19224:42-722(+)